MDRAVIYPGQIPLETDLLKTNQFAMTALAMLAQDVLQSTTTQVSGFTCIPTGVPSLAVQLTPGRIYSLQSLEATAYSSLPADTTHQILKQGILLDTITLNTAAPVTSGQSINYLIQASYADADGTAVVLPYYNSSNPTSAYSGPAGSGTAQNTVRRGAVVASAKAGASAPTGSQVTPSPDSGYVGLFVVTVAYGQTQVLAGNISTYGSAPFIGAPVRLSQFGSSTLAALATGAVGAATGTVSQSGWEKRPSGIHRQWAVIQMYDDNGSTSVSWTFPNATLFTTGIIGMKWCNLAAFAGQGSSGAAAAGNVSLGAASVTAATLWGRLTGTVGTKFWAFVEVEGF